MAIVASGNVDATIAMVAEAIAATVAWGTLYPMPDGPFVAIV